MSELASHVDPLLDRPGRGLSHLACDCSYPTALCGTDCSGALLLDDSCPVDCNVCADLEEQPCPRCDHA